MGQNVHNVTNLEDFQEVDIGQGKKAKANHNGNYHDAEALVGGKLDGPDLDEPGTHNYKE